jgi:hypothetical protein
MKYISFSPYFSGLANVIMSYEIAFAIAYITKRTLILPPKTWLLFISESQEKSGFSDIWEIFDKEYVKSQIKCIDFYDVPEFQGKYDLIAGEKSFTKNIEEYVDSVRSIDFKVGKELEVYCINESHLVLTTETYLNEDFKDFCQNRPTLNLSEIKERFIHFENNLFGHYWYHVYPGDENRRNMMKQKINNCFRYSSRLYHLASKVRDKLGPYNAVHVRRNDFLDARKDDLKSVSNKNNLLQMLKIFFDPSVPLYISTDERDMSFFDEVSNEYNVFFYDDFEYELTELDHAVIEQIICSQAEHFYGTYLSTYTSRINIMRGIEKRQSDDDIGINFYPYDHRQDTRTVNPWKLNPDKRWQWNGSSHPQWKMERNGRYLDV